MLHRRCPPSSLRPSTGGLLCVFASYFLFSFFVANGVQMWIQLYVLTCEYLLYSLLNFNSKIYVLASCSIKKLHVLGCLVLHYPAAVAFSSHYWFCDHAKSRWEIRMTHLLPWVFCVIHNSYLNQFDLLAVSRKRRWEKSFFISDAILVRTTCHASYLLTVFKPYYSSLLVSLLICEHGKSRWQTRMTHLLPLFTKKRSICAQQVGRKMFCSFASEGVLLYRCVPLTVHDSII